MRILNITAQKPHSTGSGVYLTELVRAFAAQGCEQAVVGGVYAEDEVDFPAGVAWYPVMFSSPDLPFSICGMSDEMPYPSTRYRDMTPLMVAQFKEAFLNAVERAVREFRPDVILVHHLYLLAALLREAFPEQRIFGLCHGTCLRQLDTNPLEREFILGQVPRLDGFFCLHEEHARRVHETFGIPEAQVRIIGSGYNSGVFRRLPDGGRGEGGLLRIAYAGKIARAKGVASLLRALRQLPYGRDALRVELAGGMNARDEADLRALAEASPYPVDFLGHLTQGELAVLLNRADVFVLASYYEGLPLVLAEAMACGARCVCTDLPGVRAWMDAQIPGNGIRFVPRPAMAGPDTPEESALPAFEQALAAAMREALDEARSGAPFAPDLSRVSWSGVAARIIGIFAESR